MSILYKLRNYKLWLVLFLICFFIQALQLAPLLRFDRALIEHWQLWRLISGHFTHLNWNHFLLNMAGLSMVAFFFSSYKSSGYWILAILFISLFSSVGMLLDHQFQRYVGFSAVLHGLFIIGGRWEVRRYPLSGAVLLVIIIGKVIYEQIYGALPGSESMTGGRVAVNAHLYGALAGGLYVFKDWLKRFM